jgi:hypothetical protein
LRSSTWESEGKKLSRTQIVAERIQFGPKRLDETGGDDDVPEDAAVPSDSADDIPF